MVAMNEHTSHHWPIAGHDWAVDFLQKSIANGRLRHAYLITGPPQVGKMTLALALAMTLNCTAEPPEARPCGESRSCRKTRSGNHPDILYAEHDENTGALRIETIRNMNRLIMLKPFEARYRIAIFEDFQMARADGQDALLKTLEEPPPHAILLVLARTTENIMPTIVSRCQQIPLRPIPMQAVRQALLNVGADEAQAELLARLSGGRLGWALDVLADETLLEERAAALDRFEEMLNSNLAQRFALAEALAKDYQHGREGREAVMRLLELWQSYWRDLLLLKHGDAAPRVNIDRNVALEHLGYQLDAEGVQQGIMATRELIGKLSFNLNVRLALEAMFLRWPSLNAHWGR